MYAIQPSPVAPLIKITIG